MSGYTPSAQSRAPQRASLRTETEMAVYPTDLDMNWEATRPLPPESDSDHIMLVSPSFDILMLHPSFEKVWHRSVASFLGKKCYREIEKRQEPCAYCPGVVALRTGKAASAEVCAVLDDGTRVPFLLHAYPIYGSDGEPAGFVEKCENLATQRRADDDVRSYADLARELLKTSSTSRVLTLTLDTTLNLVGATSGYVLAIDPVTGERELLATRNLTPQQVDSIASSSAETSSSMTKQVGESQTVARIPVFCKSRLSAEVGVLYTNHQEGRPYLERAMDGLASLAASALVRIQAERLRGDATANIDAMVDTVPLPMFFLDMDGRVTSINDAAEKTFGLKRQKAVGHFPLFLSNQALERFPALLSKVEPGIRPTSLAIFSVLASGAEQQLVFRATRVHDILGNGSSYLLVLVPD